MDCPAQEGDPSLAGELRRGVNPYNLKFGALAAGAMGLLTCVLTSSGLLPGIGYNALATGALVALGLFLLFTVLHTLAHGLMGWVFQRGLALHCQGDYRMAKAWLWLAERPGMDHYDPQGVALKALIDCRTRLAKAS